MKKNIKVKELITFLKGFDQELPVGIEANHCDCGGFLRSLVVIGTKEEEEESYPRFNNEKVLVLRDAG